MKPIKFRAWDKRRKRMIEVTSISFRDGTIQEDTRYAVNRKIYLDDVVLMQYTGLKDKNGVEIYEVDIIKLIGTYKGSKGKELGRFKVGWNDYYTGFDPLIDDHLRVNSEWEVIGNIYENPELLEEQNK